MKKLILILVFCYSITSFAQDVIILKNGDEIKAKVTDILSKEVKYKRASNPTGPTYTLQISKIFMIRYQSGDKDVFGNIDEKKSDYSNTSSKAVVKKGNPTVFVYDPEIGDPYCQIKKQFGGKLYGTRGNEVFYRHDIIFYGFDLTYLKLTNRGKIGDGILLVPKYYEAWNEMLTHDLLPFRKISSWMGKPTLLLGNSVFPNYHQMDAQNFVTSVNQCVPFEDLKKIVTAYVLREKEGIGMVVNVINFNKEREYSLIYVTFFDIATREIMFAVEASGKAGGSGMTKHWAEGVSSAFREIFIDEVFKPKRSTNYQMPGKLLFY